MFWSQKSQSKTLGLALGGGAARGIAHIGVLKALQEHHIRIDAIAGVSAGAIAGALYCAGTPLDQMEHVSKKLNWLQFVGIHFQGGFKGMLSSQPIESFILNHISERTFNDLSIPFAVVATDILSGQPIVFSDPKTEIAPVVRASATIPGIFEPTSYEDNHYIDGGITQNVPVDAVKSLGVDRVIAIDVIPEVKLKKLPSYLPTLVDRSIDLLLKQSSLNQTQKADIVIYPIQQALTSFQLQPAEQLIQDGYNATIKEISKIKKVIK